MIAVLDNASPDDQPLTSDEEQAADAALKRYHNGEAVPLDQVLAELDRDNG